MDGQMDKMSCKNSFAACGSLGLRDVVNRDVGGEGELDLSTTYEWTEGKIAVETALVTGQKEGQNEL